MLIYYALFLCNLIWGQAIKYELCEKLNVIENNSTCQFIMSSSTTSTTTSSSSGNNSTQSSNATSSSGDAGNNYKPKSQCENCTKCKSSSYLCEFGCESLKLGISLPLVQTYIQNLMGDDKCIDKTRSKCQSCTKGKCNDCINQSLEFYDGCQRWGTAFDKSTGAEMGECFDKCNNPTSVKSYQDFFTCTFSCYLPGFKQINKQLNNITDIKLNTDSNSIKNNLDQYWQLKNICYDQSQISIDNNSQFTSSGNEFIHKPNKYLLGSVTLLLLLLFIH